MHLAGFLCTKFPLPAPPPATDGISVPFSPRLPHSLRVTNPQASRPIYWLPYRLLPSQEDQIDDQIDAVKKAIRKEKDDWLDVKEEKQDALAAAKRKRDEQLDELDRKDREERQKRRRQDEEREEKTRGSRRSPSREEGRMDIENDGPTGNGGDREEDSAEIAVKGMAAAAPMEGDDDLEY